MERGQIPQTQPPPDSDVDFMDIDEVVPDTPDRMSSQEKNILKGASMSATSNSRNYGLPDRGFLGRRDLGFAGSVQNSGVCSHSFNSSTDISHPFNNQQSQDENILHFRGLGRSHNHQRSNGPVFVENGELENSSIRIVRDSSQSIDQVRIDNDGPVHYVAHPKKKNDSLCNVASENNTGKGLSAPSQSVRLPCMASRKRLVWNGCISPHNIEKGKQLAGNSVNVSADVGGDALSGSSSHVTDVNEVIAKDNAAALVKGKGVVIPTCSSKDHKDRIGAAGLFSGLWRKGKQTDSVFGQDTSSNSSILDKFSSSVASAVPEPVLLLNEGLVRTPSATIKKQKKRDSSLSSLEKNTEAICLSSCGKSSAEKSTMEHGGCSQRIVGSPIAIGELSSEVRESDSQSEARKLQVQLDEMLARELQEQLYNEMPEAATGELSRGHASVRPRGRHHEYGARAVPESNTQRPSQSGSFRNRLGRRGAQTWFPTSSIVRLRNRINRSSSLISSEGREMLFPEHMDLDMRMELLEALEEVFDDDSSMVNQLLDSDREFDENDYELLSALDDNNHEHLGASAAQIANLPESTVHNDSFEACSICLETPVVGDTIRHLPCLHKFHKGCIDPWLRRKRSCPVCKSDI